VRHCNYYKIANTAAIYYKSLSVGCRWSRLLWQYHSFINTIFVEKFPETLWSLV